MSVRVKKRFEDRKYKAVVVAVGNECDIALLKIVEEEEEQFWGGYEKPTYHGMKGGVLPALQDAVLVIGYPSPGEMISVTKGVSSRVEMLNYVHGQGELLAVQIDAAVRLQFSLIFILSSTNLFLVCQCGRSIREIVEDQLLMIRTKLSALLFRALTLHKQILLDTSFLIV